MGSGVNMIIISGPTQRTVG